MNTGRFLRSSRQSWKLWVAAAGLITSGAFFAMARLSPWGRSDSTAILLSLAGCLLWLFAILWAVFSLRCPRCGHRVLWQVLRQAEVRAFVPRLVELEACPRCAYPGDQPPPGPASNRGGRVFE